MKARTTIRNRSISTTYSARLRITALRASSGPGIEFLEYLSPRDGPMPVDEKANDLMHWQTRLLTPDAGVAAQAARSKRIAFISSGVVTLPEKTLGFSKGFLIQDPDGHVMELVER